MDYKRSEIRAGAFLLLSFAVLVVMVFTVSDVASLFRKKKDVRVLFQHSDGIEKNAPVRYSGTRVGRVREVRVAPEYDDRVEVTLRVYRSAIVRQDTRAAIRTLGIVGGKYVELSSGSPGSALLDEGAVLTGEESLKLEDLTRIGIDAAGRLRNIAENLENMLGDPALAKSLAGTVKNLQAVSANLSVMTSNREEVAEGLKILPDLLKSLEQSAESLKSVTARTDALVEENRKTIDATLENVKEITNNLKEITEDVKKHPWKLIRKP